MKIQPCYFNQMSMRGVKDMNNTKISEPKPSISRPLRISSSARDSHSRPPRLARAVSSSILSLYIFFVAHHYLIRSMVKKKTWTTLTNEVFHLLSPKVLETIIVKLFLLRCYKFFQSSVWLSTSKRIFCSRSLIRGRDLVHLRLYRIVFHSPVLSVTKFH